MYTFLTIISIPILILIRIWTRKFSINKELKEFWNFNMEILEKYVQRNENPIFSSLQIFSKDEEIQKMNHNEREQKKGEGLLVFGFRKSNTLSLFRI